MSKKKIRRPQQYKRSQERTMKEWWQDLNDMNRKRILWSCTHGTPCQNGL